MNNIFTYIFLLLLLASCSKSKSDILQQNIEEIVKKGLHDPESYEFESIFIDSSGHSLGLESIRLDERKISELENKSLDQDLDTEISGIRSRIENQKLTNSVRYPFKNIGHLSFRSNNSIGAKILNKYNFGADEDFSIMYVVDNRNDTIYKTY